jgi:hypothetical protein
MIGFAVPAHFNIAASAAVGAAALFRSIRQGCWTDSAALASIEKNAEM